MVKEVTIKNNTEVSKEVTSSIVPLVDDSIIQNARPPYIKLLQKNSDAIDNGEQPGTYYNDLLMMSYGPEIEVLPIACRRGAFYIKKNERKLICRSDDGVTSMNGDSCAQCPYGVYHAGKWVDGKSPDCHTTMNLVCLEVNSDLPCVIPFKVKSLKEGEKIAMQIRASSKRPIGIILGSSQEKNESGSFYVPRVKKTFFLTEEQVKTRDFWIKKFEDVVLASVDEANAE